MSSHNYVGEGSLAPELGPRVQSELSAGERLVYVGQPKPELYRGPTVFMAVFGGCFAGVALVMLIIGGGMALVFAGAGAAAGGPPGGLAGCFPLFFCLFTLPFLAIGGYLLAAPIWMPKRIRRIIYALTGRRALIFEPNWFGQTYTVRSYTTAGLGHMVRTDRGNGAGDLVFEEYYTTRSDSSGVYSTSRNQRGFLAIDRVRDVEELVRLTLGL